MPACDIFAYDGLARNFRFVMTQLKFNVATCVSYYTDIKGGCRRDRRKMGKRYDKGPHKIGSQAQQSMYVHVGTLVFLCVCCKENTRGLKWKVRRKLTMNSINPERGRRSLSRVH